MRNDNRIEPCCERLAHIWHMVPDWRMSQLMMNAAAIYANRHNGRNVFYLEDEDFLDFLEEFIKETIENA